MSRSKNRLVADWFAKIRANANTGEVEHADVADMDLSVKADTTYVDSAVANLSTSFSGLSDTTVSTSDPTITSNPTNTGHLWLNKTSGEIFVCYDTTTNANECNIFVCK